MQENYVDEDGRVNVEIMRILSKQKGYLSGREIEEKLPEKYRAKLSEHVSSFPNLTKSIYFRLSGLEQINLVSSFDKNGNANDLLSPSEKFYELTDKGRAVVGEIPKDREALAGRLVDIIGKEVAKENDLKPEEVYRLFLEMIDQKC